MQEPKIHILAETTHWLAISKPPGIVTEQHPRGKPSVETIVLNYLKANSRREKPFLGVVHRLDKVTSGVLLMAKKKISKVTKKPAGKKTTPRKKTAKKGTQKNGVKKKLIIY